MTVANYARRNVKRAIILYCINGIGRVFAFYWQGLWKMQSRELLK